MISKFKSSKRRHHQISAVYSEYSRVRSVTITRRKNLGDKNDALVNYWSGIISARGTEGIFTLNMSLQLFQEMNFESLVKILLVPKNGDRVNISNALPFSWEIG